MPAHNSDIASMLTELADILDIEGANPFRVRAYRNAARTVSGFSSSIRDLVERNEDLTSYPGIGKELAAKIMEIVETGSLNALEKARQRISSELVDLMYMQGLGPKRVKTLHQELGVKSFQDLKEAARSGKIASLSGFGPKLQKTILEEIDRFEGQEKRFSISVVEDVALSLEKFLQNMPGVELVRIAGSFRRRKETVGDLDMLVCGSPEEEIMQGFIAYEDVVQVLSHGQTKSSVVLKNGIQVDLRLVAKESFGAALHYFTGSKAHNIAVRRIAQDLGLKINEYGVFKDEHFEAGTSEQEVYACVGLPYFEPELREDRGEIQAAQENQLPELVGREHLRGDLHVHSNYSDGVHSLQELAQAAKNFGYEYLAVTDHTQNLSVAKGLDPKRLSRQIEEIDRVNAEMPEIVLLKSAEVDILEDGSLDLPDWILKELDLCVCSVHTAFRLSKKKQTERILRAMDNPYFNIFGHPSGRLIGSRPAYELEMARILQGAKERGCVLELNSQPDRLDLDDVHCRAAKEAGVKVAISTDAHRRENLNIIRFGIGQARRGWLEPEDVINTRPLRELRELIRR